MNDSKNSGVSRRKFLIGTATAGVGLTIGVSLTGCHGREGAAQIEKRPDEVDLAWDPQAFVRIGTDNKVTVFSKHTEMGQGAYTGLATIVAEELDADWEQIMVEGAPANAALYANLRWGFQGTGGSSSIRNSFAQMRQVGAAARQMMVTAAAVEWDVPAEEITVIRGVVYHGASDHRSNFGELAESAARQTLPEKVALKSRDQFTLMGTELPRIDVPGKTNGSAVFTQDLKLPGMLTAVVAHAPRFGATVKSLDDRAARESNGVEGVYQIPSGVAVVADNFWSALKGRELLSIEWDDTNAFTKSSDDLASEFRELAKTPGPIVRDDGFAEASIRDAAQYVEAEFEFPYLAHASLEPLNCVVQLSDDGCEIWNAAQYQTPDQADVSRILGLDAEKIRINMLFAGGAYGRRGCKDYVAEATHVAKAVNGSAPIKLVWTREDDMTAGHYRPLNVHRVRGGLDGDGHLVAWHHRIVGQSIAAQEKPEWLENGLDWMSHSGVSEWPYSVPDLKVESHSPDVPVPVLWYRGVESTHNLFVVEAFIDELAAKAGRDPVDLRRAMLVEQPRLLNVMELAVNKANWSSSLPIGRGRGIAIAHRRDSYVALVAEVSKHGDGTWSVDRVVASLDCGLLINPDNVRAQIEGGIGFGLSSTLADEITIKDGYVEQTNFDKYRLLRIDQMPKVDVHLVESEENPGGVGELAPMLIGPAVANALFVASGKRYRKLPIGPMI
jgi:isoquinoline 1-oxidoreductase beta subunit